MAVRFQCTFENVRKIEYTVKIHDANYGGAAISVTLANPFFTINYDQSSDLRTEYIKGSRAEVSIIANNSNFINWYNNNLLTGKEDDFILEIFEGNKRIWLGYIINDMVTVQDIAQPYEVTIGAVCGVARLKDFTFDFAFDNQNTRYNLITYFYELFKRMPFYKLYPPSGGSVVMFGTSFNWHNSLMPAYSNSFDPLFYTYLMARILTKTSGNENEPMSNYEALEILCKAYQIRYMMSGGVYRLYNISGYNAGDGISMPVRYYTNGGALLTTGTEATQKNITQVIGATSINGGQWQHYPPLQQTRLKYKYERKNLLDPNLFEYTPPILINDYVIGGTNRFLKYQTIILVQTGLINPSDVAIEIIIKLKLGNKYLNKIQFSSNASWTTNSADRYYDYVELSAVHRQQNIALSFTTPEIPLGTYNPNEFEVTFNAFNKNTGAPVTITIQHVTGTSILEFSNSSTDEETYLLYIANNTANKWNSEIYEIETFIDDGLTGNETGSIWVRPNNNTPVEIEPSSGVWKLNGSGTGFQFNTLWVREFMAGQLKAVPRYQNTIEITEWQPHDRIKYQGAMYLFNGGKFEAQSSQWDGEWYVIQYATADLNIPDVFNPNTNNARQVYERTMGDVFNTAIHGNALAYNSLALQGVTTIDDELTGTISSIDVGALLYPLYEDDVLYIVAIGQPPVEITVTSTASIGDTTININSITLTQNIEAGAYICKGHKQGLFEKVRLVAAALTPTESKGRIEYDGKTFYITPYLNRHTIDNSNGYITSDVTVSNTTTPTVIYDVDLDADSLSVGKSFDINLTGKYSTANASDTFTIELFIGATSVASISSEGKNVTDNAFKINVFTTIRTIGASGSCVSYLEITTDKQSKQDATITPHTIDTTQTNNISIKVTWISANAGNILTLQQGVVTFKN